MAQQARFYEIDGSFSSVSLSSGGTEIVSYTTPFVVSNTAVKVNGISYDMSRQGLYRFWNPDTGFYTYRIVVASAIGGNLDIYAFHAALSSIHMIGTDHNIAYGSITQAMVRGRINCQCGYIAGVHVWLLPQAGIDFGSGNVRALNVQTLGPKNFFDDGHIIHETKHGSSWRMWDSTNGNYFLDSNGVHMSTSAFIAQIANGGPFPTMVHMGTPKLVSNDRAGNLPLKDYIEEEVAPNLEAWYRDKFQSIV
jgi:hypothetical protein